MLASQQNVPRIIFMQIGADVFENKLVVTISAKITHIRTNKVYKPMFSGSKILTIPFLI